MAFWRDDRGCWVASVRVAGRWRYRKIGATSQADAARIERESQRQIDEAEARQTARAAEPVPVTLRDVMGTWIARRAALGKSNVESEKTHLERHVLPLLGDRRLVDVNRADAIRVVQDLAVAKLAPRTLRNVHGTVARLWEDLVEQEVVPVNPWRSARAHLPRIEDRDPEWRIESTFTHEEIEALIFDERIPEPRRVVNALLSLAGLRIGEAAALRRRHYDASYLPLGRLTIAWSNDRRTKTRDTRLVPVHPALAAVLDTWLSSGWEAAFGRQPGPDDLIVPGPPGPQWSDKAFRMRFQNDLARIGLRVRAGAMGGRRSPHGLRASFLTLAVEDGANFAIVDRVAHRGHGRGAGQLYLRPSWEALCREVEKLRIGGVDYQLTTERWAKAASRANTRQYLVAGEGLEPSTYGL